MKTRVNLWLLINEVESYPESSYMLDLSQPMVSISAMRGERIVKIGQLELAEDKKL